MHHASDKGPGGGASCASHIALISNAESPATGHGNREKTEQPKGILLSLWPPCESYVRKMGEGHWIADKMDPSRVSECVSEVQKIASIAWCRMARRLSQGLQGADNSHHYHLVKQSVQCGL
jgi:hypothetical protein